MSSESKTSTSASPMATPVVSNRAARRRRSRQAERLRAIQLMERSDTPENERAVRATKTEGVLERDIDLQVPRRIGAVVEVALRILIEDIDGRRRLLVIDRE